MKLYIRHTDTRPPKFYLTSVPKATAPDEATMASFGKPYMKDREMVHSGPTYFLTPAHARLEGEALGHEVLADYI